MENTKKTSRSYKVAGHVFNVEADFNIDEFLDNYEPFAVETQEPAIFTLNVVQGVAAPAYIEEVTQNEEGQQILCGRNLSGENMFDFQLRHKSTGVLVCSTDYKSATVYVSDYMPRFCLNNSLMVLFALATAGAGTLLFHSAVISHEKHAYMFLGKSGTGKSTHARLWLKHIAGTDLLNDDNPVVRIVDNEIRVYGSPWSGKTPCYKNESYPLGGLVLLSQAPFNKISRISGIEAYIAIISSVSGKRWERWIADALHATENTLAKEAPVWHLECLPDEEAATLCFETIKVK